MKNLSETKEKEITTEIEKKDSKPTKIKLFPEICSFTNEKGTGYNIEIYLPGVEKETIELKMNKEYISVKGETENIEYEGSYQLCCPVDPEKAESVYKEGLLKIQVPFKEIELKTLEVKVQ